jgi:phosphatidylglycerophosphate synthase
MSTHVVTTSRAAFTNARRVNQSLTAGFEKPALEWMATRAPGWVSSDQLTLLGFAAQIGAGACFALAGSHRLALAGVILCIVLNWLGDSLDGTLARVRCRQRPRYGFYVDHISDLFGAIALMGGLACSGFLHGQTAIALLIGFLLLSGESFLATYTLSRFELSHGWFGPTEIRILLIAGCLALLRSPYSYVLGFRFLLFDLGGWIAAVAMFFMAVSVAIRHTAQLYREEPLP